MKPRCTRLGSLDRLKISAGDRPSDRKIGPVLAVLIGMEKVAELPMNGSVPAARSDASPPALCFDGVWRHFGRGENRRPVLRGVDLEIAAGTVTGIAGVNGAGKTTLLRIATGILEPSRGTVRVDGMTSRGHWREYHRRVGFLSAGDRGLYPRLTVEDHLRYWVRVALMPSSQCGDAVSEALERFELLELRDRRADRLSQGQRQRLRLALAFVHKPKLLLLDEPRNSLDADGTEILVCAVERVARRGAAVVWAHPTGEDQPVAFDHQLVIQEGAVTEL